MPLTTIKTHGIFDEAVTQAKTATSVTELAGSTHILSVADADTILAFTNAEGVTLTLPSDVEGTIPLGTAFRLTQLGTGAVTAVGDIGVSVNSVGSSPKTSGQYAVATLIKQSSDDWIMTGGLEGISEETLVSIRAWGAGGGGGTVVLSHPSREGADGGIAAGNVILPVGTNLKIVVGAGGAGVEFGVPQSPQTGDIPGGTGLSTENQGGGNGGDGSGAFLASVSVANALVVAGGGGGGNGNYDAHGGNGGGDGTGNYSGEPGGKGEATTTAQGGTPTSGGAGAVSSGHPEWTGEAGGSLSGGDASLVPNVGSVDGAGGGGGIFGGGGGIGGPGSGGGGGAGVISASHMVSRDADAESLMIRRPGGARAFSSNDSEAGSHGAVEIVDGAGSTAYSTPGTYTHVVS